MFFSKVFCVLAGLLFVQASWASDPFEEDEYPSGFNPSAHCEELLFSEIHQLAAPISRFKALPLAKKIKSIHTIVHGSVIPPLGSELLQDLSIRLRLIAEVSPRKLLDYSDELLLIGVQAGQLIDTETFPEKAIAGFVKFFDEVNAVSNDDTQARMMFRVGVQAHLAHLKIVQMKFADGQRKSAALLNVNEEIAKTWQMGYEARGHGGMKWLALPFEAIKIVIQQFDSFDERFKPHLHQWLRVMLKTAFEQPEEMFLNDGTPLPQEIADLILTVSQMPQTKRFPLVHQRCAQFFALLEKLIRSKSN